MSQAYQVTRGLHRPGTLLPVVTDERAYLTWTVNILWLICYLPVGVIANDIKVKYEMKFKN